MAPHTSVAAVTVRHPSRPAGATARPQIRGAWSARCLSPRAGWGTTSRRNGESSWPAGRQSKTSPTIRYMSKISLWVSYPQKFQIQSQVQENPQLSLPLNCAPGFCVRDSGRSHLQRTAASAAALERRLCRNP